LKGTSVLYVDELAGWLNNQAEVTGAEKVEGYSKEWQEESKLIPEKYIKLIKSQDTKGNDSGSALDLQSRTKPLEFENDA
jgi:hypothetical protein